MISCRILYYLLLIGFTNSFKISNLKKYNFRGTNSNFKLRMSINESPSKLIQSLVGREPIGKEWNFNDLVENINNHNVDGASIVNYQDNIKSALIIDSNHGDVVNAENIHYIKTTLEPISKLVLDKLVETNIPFDIYTVPGGLFDSVPLPIQFIGYYLIGSIVISTIFRAFQGRGGGMGNGFGNPINTLFKSNEVVSSEDVDVTFNEVAGCDEAKYELVEVVEFLKNPSKFKEAGATIPKGVLLDGPPGTGKTLLARAVAGEAGVSFIPASGSQFIEMFVGVGASRVRKLFETAKENEPCVIFIDEIDAIGRQRGAGLAGGNDEREQTLNELLTKMDGFNKDSSIIVLGATNRADILDSALTRPGRFDRKITVGLPDIEGRKDIMDVHFKDKKLDDKIDFSELAALTTGFSGADIANLANEAAILSVRYNQTEISRECLSDAYEKMTIGLPVKTETRPYEIINLIAYHEAGHTITSLLFNEFFDVRKVTINSNRGGAGGYTLFTPKEKYNNFPTKKFMLANLIVAMGGRAAETILYQGERKYNNSYDEESLFGNFKNLDVTTGASNDLKQANSIARRFVSIFGLTDNIGLYDGSAGSDQPFLGRDIASNSDRLSEYSKEQIDKEIEKLVTFAYEKSLEILEKNKNQLEQLVEVLKLKRTVNQDDLKSLELYYS